MNNIIKHYPVDHCVLCTSGEGWPDDNTRVRGEPEDFGKNAIAYLDKNRRSPQSPIRGRQATSLLGE